MFITLGHLGHRPQLLKNISAGQSVFYPTQISDLSLWLDASDTSTIVESSGLVSQWDDKSGNGYNVLQGTTSYQPVTGTYTLNDLNVIDFNGTTQILDNWDDANDIYAGDMTMFIMASFDATGSTDIIATFTNQGDIDGSTNWNGFGGAYFEWHFGGDSISNFIQLYDDGTGVVTGTTDTASQKILYVKYSVGGYATVGTNNGETLVSTATTKTTQSTATLFRLGVCGDLGSTRGFDGKLGEVIAFHRELSSVEINQVGQYLAEKWGMSWTSV